MLNLIREQFEEIHKYFTKPDESQQVKNNNSLKLAEVK